jgi:pantetheine-phosphate adenylyltransferase
MQIIHTKSLGTSYIFQRGMVELMERAICKRAVYAGSFDPITNGHLWMMEQGVLLFDDLIIAIGVNPDKKCAFSLKERLQVVKEVVKAEIRPCRWGNIHVVSFENQFLVDYANSISAQYILRGIRNSEDYDYERAMRHVNSDLQASVSTVFLMPPREISEVSSSLVKGLIGPDGWEDIVNKYVPKAVFELIYLHKEQNDQKSRLSQKML